ncbi:hypothetical protein CHS0354_042108 [Potamilus streckersoni]|uniref:Uncharacterized protein n=1 Tax=Potamilus streckersoni TaxID=2493646 RepID=A0AAE0WHU3_9BIVA|nr:hypothetical protein CHS0354_042108 [Potamilus streckersoni]
MGHKPSHPLDLNSIVTDSLSALLALNSTKTTARTNLKEDTLHTIHQIQTQGKKASPNTPRKTQPYLDEEDTPPKQLRERLENLTRRTHKPNR